MVAQVIPAPNPVITTIAPGRNAPAVWAFSMVSGMVAAQLLPVCSMTLWLLAKSMPVRLQIASMMRMLA